MLSSKDHMLEALRVLAADTPISKIRVNDIIKKANCGRNTFYYYFRSKDEACLALFEKDITACPRFSDSGGYLTIYEFEYIIIHSLDAYKNIFASSAIDMLMSRVKRELSGYVRYMVNEKFSEYKLFPEDREFLIHWHTHCSCEILRDYGINGFPGILVGHRSPRLREAVIKASLELYQDIHEDVINGRYRMLYKIANKNYRDYGKQQ